MPAGSPTDVPKPGSSAFLELKKRERDFCEAYHEREDGVEAYDLLKPKEQEWVNLYFTMGRSHTAVSRAMGYAAPRKHGWRMSTSVHIRATIAERLAALRIEANDVLYRIEQRATATAEDFLRFEEYEHTPRVRVPLAEAIERARAELQVERRVGSGEKDPERAEASRQLQKSMRRRIERMEIELDEDPEATALVDGEPETRERAVFDLARMREAGKLHLVKSVTKNADGSQKVELHDAAKADELLGKHLGLFAERLDLTTGGEPLREVRVEIVPPRTRGDA